MLIGQTSRVVAAGKTRLVAGSQASLAQGHTTRIEIQLAHIITGIGIRLVQGSPGKTEGVKDQDPFQIVLSVRKNIGFIIAHF